MHLKETLKPVIQSEINYQKFRKHKCIIHNESKIKCLRAKYGRKCFFFPKIIAYFLAEKTHRTGFDVVSISSCEILMLIYMYIQTVSLESS